MDIKAALEALVTLSDETFSVYGDVDSRSGSAQKVRAYWDVFHGIEAEFQRLRLVEAAYMDECGDIDE